VNLKSYILLLSLLCTLMPGVIAAESQKGSSDFSLDDAVSKIRAQTKGRILSAKTVRDNGKSVHQIKVLTKDGRVQRFQVDAKQSKRRAPRKGQR